MATINARHNCGAKVLVKEINPEAATNIERAGGRIRVSDPKYIKVGPRAPRPLNLEDWQKKELQMLRDIREGMERHLTDERAQSYLAQRGVSLENAGLLRVGYIPASLPPKYRSIEKWRDHIVFSVYHPEHGLQFAGRNLHLWQPGMDEYQHKDLLEQRGIKRWRKTHACGWFNLHELDVVSHVVLCEGAFDALALIDAGLPHVVAVVGTAVNIDWLPKHLEQITLAFDGDPAGVEKASTTAHDLYLAGYNAVICTPPDDGEGKDWSERYRKFGREGVEQLLDAEELYQWELAQAS
jgi:hypothetical protein